MCKYALLILLLAFLLPGKVLSEIGVSGLIEERFPVRFVRRTPSENPSLKVHTNVDFGISDRLNIGVEIKAGYNGLIIHSGKSKDPFINPFRINQTNAGYIDVNELYVDLFFDKMDIRVGKQKISWGVLDEYQPTDNFNPEDYSRFMQDPENERKIGIPALKLDYYADSVNVEWIFAPMFFPYRLAEPDNRWFPPMLDVAKDIRGYLEQEPFLSSMGVSQSLKNWDYPRTLSSFSTGLKISKYIKGFDTNLYYFTGYEPLPVFSADVFASTRIFPPGALYKSSIDVDLYPVSRRMHMIGGDLTKSVAGMTIRLEGAFFHGRLYNRDVYKDLEKPLLETDYAFQIARGVVHGLIDERSFSSRRKLNIDDITLSKDSISWGIGADYLLPKKILLIPSGSFLTLQFTQDAVLSHGGNLISEPFTNRFSTGLKNSFKDGIWELSSTGAYQIENKSFLGNVELIYKYKPSVQLVANYFFVGGDSSDIIGQFRDFDEITFKIRYLF